jgi:phenylalanyl-tRNA synthetase alpha chain
MDLQSIEKNALEDLDKTQSLSEIESIYTRYLGRKEGHLTNILKNIGSLPVEEKKRMGQEANRLRTLLEEKFSAKQKTFQEKSLLADLEKQKVDLTLPGTPYSRGKTHPILQTINEICDIFKQIGFDVVEGPEVEFDQHNFTDLNIPENHSARDMHDTFYLEAHGKNETGVDMGRLLLRTHTSPVQARIMRSMQPPVRIISPGRVFRHEATDATHAAVFHQIEGLYVDKNVSFSDLKGTLAYFSRKFFGSETKVRFSPSYFPFVEPGAQMDVQCFLCQGTKRLPSGDACSLCKATGWIEMLGAGMVHPQVLRNVGYDPKKVSGFAFGMGVERIVMTLYQIRDIRYFLESDLRFLEQFS